MAPLIHALRTTTSAPECLTLGGNWLASTLHQPFAVISTTAGFRAAYDANGNMLSRVEISGTQQITYTQQWNAENQLSVVTSTVNSAVTRFAYDADGKRVVQTLPNGSRTVYVSSLEVSITGTQRITKTYYVAGAQMVAMRVISSTGNVLYFIHGDHLGSTSLVTCGGTGGCNGIPYQGVVAQQLYQPYGVPRWISGTLPTDVGFTGQHADATGLMFYNARYYSGWFPFRLTMSDQYESHSYQLIQRRWSSLGTGDS